MTVDELIRKFNTDFQMNNWPETYEVDHETYANCCQRVFTLREKFPLDKFNYIEVFVGKSSGLMLKNVELLLR